MSDLENDPQFYYFSVAGEGYQHVPSWVWVLAGFLNFTAYTLGDIVMVANLSIL